MKNRSRTDKEIYQIARDVLDGKIYGSWNKGNPEDTFITLKNPEVLEKARELGTFHVFEYLANALPEKIDDSPVFSTFEILNRYDVARLDTALHRLSRHKAKT